MDIYQELVDRVGGEQNLITLVLTEYMLRNKVIKLKAHAVGEKISEKKFRTVVQIAQTTSKSIFIDEQEL